jgi:hypothetical protein
MKRLLVNAGGSEKFKEWAALVKADLFEKLKGQVMKVRMTGLRTGWFITNKM